MKKGLLLLPLLAMPALAQTGLLVPTEGGRPDARVLSLREMAVDIGVARGYARVNVRQVYENHTPRVQEGTWRFRLPESGLVGDFAVWDGLVRIPGVILEKRRARAIYRDLTTQRIDPGLLQQGEEEDREPSSSGRAADRPSGGALFSVKVAPIPSYGTKRLEMQYQHEVPWLDGVAELRFPLKPGDGEPMTAASLRVTVTLLDGTPAKPVAGSLPLTIEGARAIFTATNVKLDKDVVLRFTRAAKPLALTAFRNPAGQLPDGLALAPWERPADVPPEKDGFFLLEWAPKGKTAAAATASTQQQKDRGPLAIAFLFDTSLSHRWQGLETAYAVLVNLLDSLKAGDRFALIPFDRAPAPEPAGLAAASADRRRDALTYLRSRPLSPGTDVAAAVKAGAAAVQSAGKAGRVVLLTDGAGPTGDLVAARGAVPLFSILTGEERRESYGVASSAVLGLAEPSLESAEASLFLRQLLEPVDHDRGTTGRGSPSPSGSELPVKVSGGDPKLRDVYAVMTQPPIAGALSGWVGRYQQPVASATLAPKDVAGAPSLTAPFPETALEARDLPRRWAKARVDDLLRRIELEGEKSEWVNEIIELSRRYKFVTPYTAFLAAPRSLLRPRRIQPGDPVIRIEADPGIVAASALFPFGARVELSRMPKSNVWQGRFLVPEGLPDGRIAVRLVLRDVSGSTFVETKHVVLDGTAPVITPDAPRAAERGKPLAIAVRADADVIFLSARLADGPPVPLRWDDEKKRNVAELPVPPEAFGRTELFFEASDAAGNHGFARLPVEVR